MTATIHVLTTEAHAVQGHKRHGYTCDCEPCVIDKIRPPAVCRCDRPVTHSDPRHCIRCGHDVQPIALGRAA